MDRIPERRVENAAPSGDVSLLRLVQQLGADGVPLCREFAEMMLVDIAGDADPMVSSYAAVELMSEPPTRAEDAAARLLTAVARFVRDEQLDDESLGTLLSGAARYLARFESYLAERTAC
jgi:hypothetical protein